jgi:ABC-type uncharacterized transport system substrate-binding protein
MPKRLRTCLSVWLGAFLLAAGSSEAGAHPHVFVHSKAVVVFGKDGLMTAVRNVWEFDQAFSAFSVQGLDANGDGRLTTDELKSLARTNVDSLKQFGYFTHLDVDGARAAFREPAEYGAEMNQGRLTLSYTLPLKAPLAVGRTTVLDVFDPAYFVAFTFAENPIALEGAPKGCVAEYHPPKPLDPDTMAALGRIPLDQHDLPPDLVEPASTLANIISIECPGVLAKPPAPMADAIAAQTGAKSRPPEGGDVSQSHPEPASPKSADAETPVERTRLLTSLLAASRLASARDRVSAPAIFRFGMIAIAVVVAIGLFFWMRRPVRR